MKHRGKSNYHESLLSNPASRNFPQYPKGPHWGPWVPQGGKSNCRGSISNQSIVPKFSLACQGASLGPHGYPRVGSPITTEAALNSPASRNHFQPGKGEIFRHCIKQSCLPKFSPASQRAPWGPTAAPRESPITAEIVFRNQASRDFSSVPKCPQAPETSRVPQAPMGPKRSR